MSDQMLGYGLIALLVLAGVIVLQRLEGWLLRASEARYRARYPAGALIADAARAGKLAEAGGMSALVQRVAHAADPTAEVATVRAAYGVPDTRAPQHRVHP